MRKLGTVDVLTQSGKIQAYSCLPAAAFVLSHTWCLNISKGQHSQRETVSVSAAAFLWMVSVFIYDDQYSELLLQLL